MQQIVAKKLEQQFGINLFDRFNFAYRDGEKVLSLPRHDFEALLKEGKINKIPFDTDNTETNSS